MIRIVINKQQMYKNMHGIDIQQIQARILITSGEEEWRSGISALSRVCLTSLSPAFIQDTYNYY